MHSFPRPQEPHLVAAREPAPGTCPECGSDVLADYRVLSEGGWWDVRKCQACLHSLNRVPAPPFQVAGGAPAAAAIVDPDRSRHPLAASPDGRPARSVLAYGLP